MSGLPHVILDARRFEYFSVDSFYEILAGSLARLLESRRSVSKYLGMIRGISISGLTIEFSSRGSSTFAEVLEALNKWGEDMGASWYWFLMRLKTSSTSRGLTQSSHTYTIT